MPINQAIFKAYDIRGVYPMDFGDETPYRVAQALVEFTKARRVVLGYDARKSTPKLLGEVKKGLLDLGVEVVDVGLVTTPMFYFAVASDKKAGAGLMVTASHNPAKYNGFKLVSAEARPIGGKSGMSEIAKCAEVAPFPRVRGGKIIKRAILKSYLDQVFKVAGVKKLPLKVAIDAGNGMVGVPLPTFLKRAGLQAKVLYGKVDCSFPNHEANPLKEKTLVELKKLIASSRAQVGIAYDGDADRVGFIDERGHTVPGDLVGALIATELLKKHRRALIFGDVRSGWAYKESVEAAGGKFELCPVGHANIKKLMREKGALFAAEMSYHFYFKDFFYFESALLATLLLLKIVAEKKRPLSELLKPFQKYAASGEKNFEVKNAAGVIAAIRKKYGSKAEKIADFDGLRLEFTDWWLSFRASNTEPLLRLNLEARTEKLMKEKLVAVVKLIK
ncbi:MAG: phosphomannomutase/phosphoglucomutase [bacterium]